MNPYIGDRQLEPDDEPDEIQIECPCGSGTYTTSGSCVHCNWQDDPGEPSEEPE